MQSNQEENSSNLLKSSVRSRGSESQKNDFIDQEHMVDYDAGAGESFSDGLLASPLLKPEKGLDSASSGGHEATSATNESKDLTASTEASESEVLARSVFVKNVDYASTQDEIKQHFKEAGQVLRITILKDKFTKRPIGHCYIEFAKQEAAIRAKILNESLFKGRQITVVPKRKNVPFKGKVQS